MIITIAGLPGAGKTSVAEELAKRLGYDSLSVGEIRGKIAIEKGITIDQLNDMGTESDHLADAKQIELGKNGKNMIIEGRISWFFIPDSVKILVTVDPDEGARRIFEEKKNDIAKRRTDEREYASAADAKDEIAKRVENDRARLSQLYGIADFSDPKHFDLILDTTNAKGPAENADKIMAMMKEKGLI